MTTKDIRILIGDNYEPTRRFFRDRAKPYEVDEVSSGEGLVKTARQATEKSIPYSLIVTGNRYSDIEGIEAIKQIRAFDEATPIALLSGSIDESRGDNDPIILAAKRAGATHAMTKDYKNYKKVLEEYKPIWDAQSIPSK